MSDLPVTLCVDALRHQLGGIGRYTWELAQRLPQEKTIESVRYLVAGRLIDDPRRLLRGEPIYRGRGIRRAARAWKVRQALRSTLVHAPNYFIPQNAEMGVVTVHDLSVFRYPETHPETRVRQFERLFADSLRRALHIITDTETVRGELIETFGVSPHRITAVALGVSPRFRPADPDESLDAIREWGLERGAYGLCVSALEPRKKVTELLSAWRRLPPTVRSRFPLVLAGGTGWMNEGIHEQLNAAIAEGWVRYLGHIPEDGLAQLYAGAALFIYPSTYEGFGLPPLEAMASGVPVIVSNRSCLPEVCGSAVLYVDPDNDNEFLSAIVEGLGNEQWRADARRLGLERAAQFTWERCTKATAAVYERVFHG